MEKLGYRECGVLVVGELWSSDLGEKENPSPYHGFGEDGDTRRATVTYCTHNPEGTEEYFSPAFEMAEV